MCGNFGLLLLNQSQSDGQNLPKNVSPRRLVQNHADGDDLDASISESMHSVSQTNGIRLATQFEKIPSNTNDAENTSSHNKLLPAIKILEAQTAATEIRGGQAGGYSAFEYNLKAAASHFESRFGIGRIYNEAIPTRVRSVARKRHPLAADLARKFIQAKKRDFAANATVTVIGHTRFATSSVNTQPELHPHEWVPFHPESVWLFNNSNGQFEKQICNVGIHITHNGDFDALEAYGQTVVVDDVGLWLERVLHVSNDLKGDSPKVAGCMDLFRVQGRWQASARLAWIRAILGSTSDVSGGQELSKSAPNSFPPLSYFAQWESFIEEVWVQHVNNIIKHIEPSSGSDIQNTPGRKQYRYYIDSSGEKQFINRLVELLTPVKNLEINLSKVAEQTAVKTSNESKALMLPSFINLNDSIHGLGSSVHSLFEGAAPRLLWNSSESDKSSNESIANLRKELGIENWNKKTLFAFISTLVRGFLRHDLYNALTEFLSRAEGSFGLQVHCSIEPGVVVIGSKGQPMSISYDPSRPVVLFASEASALAVPVTQTGEWLLNRIDLDSHGEIMRIGEPRPLLEGTYSNRKRNEINQVPKENAVITKHVEVTSIPIRKSSISTDNFNGFGIETHMLSSFAVKNSAYDLLNDRISTHEKIVRQRNSLNSSIHGSVHGSILGNSIHGSIQGSSVHGKPQVNGGIAEYRRNQPTAASILNSSYDPASAQLSLLYQKTSQFPKGVSSGSFLYLESGIEIRSYTLPTRTEQTEDELKKRTTIIESSPLPYDPTVDLVGKDISETPAVLNVINLAWDNPKSLESIAGEALSKNLVKCMRQRLSSNLDTIDLLIAGVEVSLWVAEQFAADIRTIFPQLNIVTVSANKLLSLGNDTPGKTFFPGSDAILPRKLAQHTCAMLISQSGQTFPSLHATRTLSALVEDRLWLVTGCFNSKMENVLMEGYILNNRPYMRDRIFNNYSGHRPAEPTSLAIAATWHTLTRLLLRIIDVTRRICPEGRVIHPWTYEEYAKKIQKWYRRRGALAGEGFRGLVKTMMRMNSIGRDFEDFAARRKSAKLAAQTAQAAAPRIVMLLSDGCINDINSLVNDNLVQNISGIVGTDTQRRPIQLGVPTSRSPNDPSMVYASLPHTKLVAQGHAWADHLNEPWQILVLSGAYIFLSVGLGLPICGLIADGIRRALQAVVGTSGILAFTPRMPHIIHSQGLGWTLIGLLIQCLDAVFFIYISKNMTRLLRIITGRPIHARLGKRTIVIVDNPAIHQLAENFCSKLFAQGYSFNTPDVHGAAGTDHFVHRFTHRVVRGLLYVIGRPDGRLCNLAKSEASVILAAKQAAFIRNPDYTGDGSGPEFVTIGHNPNEPSLGLAHNITLQSTIYSPTSLNSRDDINDKPQHREVVLERRRFLDELIYDRLSTASKPFTAPILRSLARQLSRNEKASNLPYGCQHIDPSLQYHNPSAPLILDLITQSKDLLKASRSENPSSFDGDSNTVYDPVYQPLPDQDLTMKLVYEKGYSTAIFDTGYKAGSNPGSRLAFLSRLDSTTQTAVELQVIVQQFYECRIASLERYMSYCVMFHAMAKRCSHPWLQVPWDIARSQSNLRVATTASPISAAPAAHHDTPKEVKELAKQFAYKLRGYKLGF